jgi:hypothetical protein
MWMLIILVVTLRGLVSICQRLSPEDGGIMSSETLVYTYKSTWHHDP